MSLLIEKPLCVPGHHFWQFSGFLGEKVMNVLNLSIVLSLPTELPDCSSISSLEHFRKGAICVPSGEVAKMV